MNLSSEQNRTIPLYTDIFWIACVVLAFGTTIAIIRSRDTVLAKVCWIIAVLVFPLVGAAVWWLVGRRRATRSESSL
ncbi:PLD nuclease N-terminal domain-containing protein [Rhodococcus qingshengii]|uniref:PLD nuclease N-terminal domain-containing protein n=1 Tax=Rhodococcus erythropolis TaxID=1833 RepID=UPI0035AFC598